ncbi:MAG TPA: glyoxylate/hydroxypyruvate reductase A [Stellaceae bacterium]|nr:glyoxylate/hydroxypyruvate reductase A [Stellaceae bacterium]
MALLFRSSPQSAARWLPQLARLLPDLEVRVHPDLGDRRDIRYALVWQPEAGLLASLPNLALILSLGAGVDHILDDPSLPRHVPIVRLVDPHMTDMMTEHVALQVLRLHRRDLDYSAQQRSRIWREHEQKNAAERRVGIMGLGALGMAVAGKLAELGFALAGWSRRPRADAGFESYGGREELPRFLGRAEILVCLLPLTAETEGILDRNLFARLPKGGFLVNVGRGAHLVEADLLAALDEGRLAGAALDVFREEPLPKAHPFWRHPRIIVTPHIAAATHPPTAAPIFREAIARFEAGLPVPNLVDPALGY